MKESNWNEPPKRICSICNDERGVLSGEYCRDNEKSPDYDDDLFGGTDYIDCWVFIRANETKEEYEERMKKRFDKPAAWYGYPKRYEKENQVLCRCKFRSPKSCYAKL